MRGKIGVVKTFGIRRVNAAKTSYMLFVKDKGILPTPPSLSLCINGQILERVKALNTLEL